jgi:hypothetical protein
MKLQVKVSLYALLTALAVFFGFRLYSIYTHRSQPSAALPSSPATNLPPAGTNATAAATNLPDPGAKDASGDTIDQFRPSGRWLADMAIHGSILFGILVGLGLLVGRDLSHFTADKVEEFLFNDEGEGIRDPDYEQAEELWKKGEYLEAVQLMRDHYRDHPREVYVALRIAEIYEKDLNNPLAAALEYEEVLKKKLPLDRWGWAAIHLSNLYTGKLKKIPQALDLLQRVMAECGDTPPAKKARERLEALQAEHPDLVSLPPPPAPAEEPPAGSKLPPGFRPLDQ